MKKIIFCGGILFLSSITVQSQITQKKSPGKATTKNSHNKTQKHILPDKSSTIILSSTNKYNAKANTASDVSNLTISDPIITSLMARANGAGPKINKSGIVGMPKSAYGFANGHITLITTGATTSGTQTGSGVVGTGTSLGTFGSVGPALEVNGKSPYAGINMWGNAMNLHLLKTDSASSVSTHKKRRKN